MSDTKNLIPWHAVRVRRFRFMALVTLAPAGLRAGTPHTPPRGSTRITPATGPPGCCWVAFAPAWYELMLGITGTPR